MKIEEGQDRYFVYNDSGQEIGEITYSHPYKDVLSIDHTYVDPAFRGHHLAGKLLQAVVDKAVKEHKKIIPACSYAKIQFERKKEYQDIQYFE
ncbi:GNAT family N-acetyltransferase [Sporolactobacillus sp. THM19-2]|jgi:predicted GNAT family acetyltransferase|uniref:GNAT family N-acetyltransferase n=1 Tax=Sporolactobacillus sp. THM19-2 TaxID=2511171 RepID=UPI0010200AB2|nr:GNAT family N-acetyltransferase [Sporolactobacillus sp. THM19-2]RYL93302.1 N-acetyltransferase [Sporolactobacillus sp. THM19-2]